MIRSAYQMHKGESCWTVEHAGSPIYSNPVKRIATGYLKTMRRFERAFPAPKVRDKNAERARRRKLTSFTAAEVRDTFEYNPHTGDLQWKARPAAHFRSQKRADWWNGRFAGKIAGGKLGQDGGLRINVGGTPHLAHRLIWLLVHGDLPEQIDHINGNRSDNRLCNLRACTQADNQHNQAVRKTNKSGYKGVCWSDRLGRWRATIFINGKQKSLGLFDCPKEAHKAYCAAADELHGAFANHGRFKQPPSAPLLAAPAGHSDGPTEPSRLHEHRTT